MSNTKYCIQIFQRKNQPSDCNCHKSKLFPEQLHHHCSRSPQLSSVRSQSHQSPLHLGLGFHKDPHHHRLYKTSVLIAWKRTGKKTHTVIARHKGIAIRREGCIESKIRLIGEFKTVTISRYTKNNL